MLQYQTVERTTLGLLKKIQQSKVFASHRLVGGTSLALQFGLIERYGSGISRICRLFKEHGLEAPVFENFQHGFRVIARLNPLSGVQTTQFSASTEASGGINGGINDALKDVLLLITETRGITTKEMSKRLNNRPIRTLERQIAKLIKLNLIERVGSNKVGGYRKV